MIHSTHRLASWFLLIGSGFFLVVFALPLFLAPLRWARAMRWTLPAERDLAVYLGRCLGAVAIALTLAGLRAAPDPARHAALIELFAAAGALLTVVHVWGAIKRTQPWTETAEIGLYAGVTALAVVVRTGLP